MTSTLPKELKDELNALATIPTEALTPPPSLEPLNLAKIAEQAELITVDDSVIDVSEAENEEDQDFLRHVGHSILSVNAQSDFIIQKVTEYVQDRASLTIGPLVQAVHQRFSEKKGGLMRFWYSLGYWHTTMANMVDAKGNALVKPDNCKNYQALANAENAYNSIQSFRTLFANVEIVDPHQVLKASDTTLTAISKLPTSYQEEQLAKIAVGEVPSEREVKELAKKPEVKLSKAEELLALAKQKNEEAKEKYEGIKADPQFTAKTPEYKSAAQAVSSSDKSLAKLEAQVAMLRLEVQDKTAAAEKADDARIAAERELQALQSDDTATRKRRVATLSQSLTATIPDLLADLQKYFAEREYYEMSVRESVEDNCRALAVFLDQKLNGEEA